MSVLESCTLNSVNVVKNFKHKFNTKYVWKFGMYYYDKMKRVKKTYTDFNIKIHWFT